MFDKYNIKSTGWVGGTTYKGNSSTNDGIDPPPYGMTHHLLPPYITYFSFWGFSLCNQHCIHTLHIFPSPKGSLEINSLVRINLF